MIQKEKSRLRVELLAKLKNFTDPDRARQNQILADKFFALPEFATARTIGFFASESFEVATDFLISQSSNSGKKVAFPRVEKNSRALEFHSIRNLSELEISEFGIRAPQKSSPKIPLDAIDLLVVPALAFTDSAERLGRGGGYFDRVLKKFAGVSVGLAFDFQILPTIPTEDFDQKVSRVLVGK